MFLVSFFEFCFAIAAHAHRTVMLPVLVFGALSDRDAAAVAEQRSNVSVKFYNGVFVFHKMTLLSYSFRLSYQA